GSWVSAVGVARAAGGLALAALAPDDSQPLSEDFLKIGDGAPLHQHVPVAARRLALRSGRLIAGRGRGSRAADAALPLCRNLGLRGERHTEPVALRAIKGHFLARCQVGVAVVLVARGAKT